MSQSPSSDKQIGMSILPNLARRIHLDISANCRKWFPSIDKQNPEVIFPDKLRFNTDDWRDDILTFASEPLKPIQYIKPLRLAIIDNKQQVQMIWHYDIVTSRQERPSRMNAAP